VQVNGAKTQHASGGTLRSLVYVLERVLADLEDRDLAHGDVLVEYCSELQLPTQFIGFSDGRTTYFHGLTRVKERLPYYTVAPAYPLLTRIGTHTALEITSAITTRQLN
jgi:hypothetical protein